MLQRSDLHKYQTDMVKRLVTQPNNYLAISMGMGKTVTTLTAIADVKEKHRVLIIAPKRVALSSWHTEIENWSHLKHLTYVNLAGKPAAKRISLINEKTEIVIATRDQVKWLVTNAKRWPFTWVVCDEASSFKNPASQRFKHLKVVRPYVKRWTLLSGTPSPQGLHDLWSQIYLLDGGVRLGKNITAFRNRWFIKHWSGFGFVPRKHADREVHQRIADLMVSMKSEDYLELPPLHRVHMTIPLEASVKKKYDQMKSDMVTELGDVEIAAMEAATLSQKLTQMANGAVYDEDLKVVHLHDSKIDAIREVIEDNPDEQLLVAYAYRHDLARLLHAFPNAKEITGNESVEQWNNGKIDMLLAHPASAGHGLNLQKNPNGNTAIWFGQTWSLELRQQFDARLMRQGKDRPVTIIDLVAEGTIDEHIIKAIDGKCSVQDALIDAIKF